MKTIRRLYFYATTGISLEVVVWGIIGLARTLFSRRITGSTVSLAKALALIAVGIPIFLFHWTYVQKATQEDEEERNSIIRGMFLYIVLMGLLIPVVQNLLAIVNRTLLKLLHLSSPAIIGAGQNFSDNFIAILVNGILGWYFYQIIQKEWESPSDMLPLLRRIYRYLWVFYGLGLSVTGIDLLLRHLFWVISSTSFTLVLSENQWMQNGITLSLVGIPLWAYTWRIIQNSLETPEEQESLLRLSVLYIISLLSVLFVLASGTDILTRIIETILGSGDTFRTLLRKSGGALALLITAGIVWGYYGRSLKENLAAVPDAPRRNGMKRIYGYILSFIGLVMTFVGILLLVSFITDALLEENVWGSTMRNELSGILSVLIIGIPTYFASWIPMQSEALAKSEEGDHARRSIVRKGYLYLVLFASVIGSMSTSAWFLFLVITALLGDPGESIDYAHAIENLILLILLGIYHWRSLRADARQSAENLNKQHQAFPVLLFTDAESTLANILTFELKKEAPALPLLLHDIHAPLSEESSSAKAVLLPANLLLALPDSLRQWLDEFSGEKIFLPPSEGTWEWIGEEEFSPKETAKALRRLAEGEKPKKRSSISFWTIFAYVIVGGILLQLIIGIVSALIAITFTLSGID